MAPAPHPDPPLWRALSQLRRTTVRVDLTHAFFPEQPGFPAFPREQREKVFDMDRGDGFNVHRHSLVGQWGTHVDPPLHFIADGRALDEIPVDEMILPLVVLDISARVAADPDATPTLDDVAAWTDRHGPIPAGAFVALRTGWGARWPDAEAMVNAGADGVSHAPGWSREVVAHLIDDAGVTAIGHEQTDTDPGARTSAGDYGCEHLVLAAGRWQIELMAHLDRVPEAGAVIVATWPRPRGGSGFPARAFAVCPA